MKSIGVNMLIFFLICALWMESTCAEDEPKATTTMKKSVTCGRHTAPNCSLCPYGPYNQEKNYGKKYCNKECKWDHGKCVLNPNFIKAVNGAWSSWGEFSACSATCGDGIMTRIRTCSNPPPSGGGKPCKGSSTNSAKCEDKSCVNGAWSSWGEWSACSATCGDATKTRIRTCSNPPPSGGGKPCKGSSTHLAICKKKKCGTHSCGKWEFECGDGECISGVHQCDGDTDCEDGLDEDDDLCSAKEFVKCTYYFRAPSCSLCQNWGTGEKWCKGECKWDDGTCIVNPDIIKAEKEKIEKIINAIQDTLANPPSTRDTTSERSILIQSLGAIIRKRKSELYQSEFYDTFKDLFLKIVEDPTLEEYFPLFSSCFQTHILPTAIQNEDSKSPLLKSKLKALFPKEVEDSAQLENKEVTINGTFDERDQCGWKPRDGKCPYKWKKGNWISTGLYAKQGQLVTVTVPENVVGKFNIRVNAHTTNIHKENLNLWKEGKTFIRPSSLWQVYGITPKIKPKTRLLSPYGGLIFIDIGHDKIKLGEFTLKFENVITSPRFKQGKTTSEEWSKALASSKSPMVEMEVPGLIFIIPRSYVDEVNLNVELVASTATRMMNAMFKMQGYVMPRPHLYVYDPGYKALHAGYPIASTMKSSVTSKLQSMENEHPQNVWGIPHEIGHSLEWPTYTPPKHVDVINNIFVQYVNEVVFKANPKNLPNLKYATAFKKTEKKFPGGLSLEGRLNIFLIIKRECSWQTFISFFKFYNEEITTKPTTGDEEYNLIARVLSEKCKKNLIPFLKWWNWPIDMDTEEATKDLPEWEGIIDTLENAKFPVKLPKDGNWNLIFRQTVNGTDELYKKGEWSRNKENIDAPNFSRLEDFENFKRPDGTFHLFLWYPELGEGNEWTQTSNPVTKKKRGVDNYKAISISYNRKWWGGLEYSTYGDKSLLDGSIGGFVKRHEWWYAIGAMEFEGELEKGGGIRGPGIPVQTVELYIDY